jgi:hypothetical protein
MDIKTTARRAVEFIWEGQDGLFELAHYPHERAHYTKTEALDSLVGHRYVAPLARKSRGSKKENVADVGNVLWADIDSLDGFDDRLQRLLPIRPSLVVFSGMKGFWIYLKLSEFVPTKKIESLNSGHIYKEGNAWKLTELGKHHTQTKLNYLLMLPRIRDNQAARVRLLFGGHPLTMYSLCQPVRNEMAALQRYS